MVKLSKQSEPSRTDTETKAVVLVPFVASRPQKSYPAFYWQNSNWKPADRDLENTVHGHLPLCTLESRGRVRKGSGSK